LLCGPNGAGKSSVGRPLLQNLPLIDTDAAAVLIAPTRPESAAVTAGRATLRSIDERVHAQRSFAVETTLSGRTHLERARSIKSRGWNVGFIFVGLASPALAIYRVGTRVAAGGHSVPSQDIVRRYHRGLANLPRLCSVADAGAIYDNSGPPGAIRLLAEVEDGQVLAPAAPLPDWAGHALRPVMSAH
jgi:predicted ABC-type ATPase